MSDDLLDRMRRNPADDWTIADVERLCRRYGIACKSPAAGSHFKISHDRVADILTIPARRPIKPKYIRLLVKLVSLVVISVPRT